MIQIIKKRNKCDRKIKSTIIKRTISEKDSGWNNKKIHQKINKIGEREYWVLTFFVVDNLEGTSERGGYKVIRILYEIKVEEEGQK